MARPPARRRECSPSPRRRAVAAPAAPGRSAAREIGAAVGEPKRRARSRKSRSRYAGSSRRAVASGSGVLSPSRRSRAVRDRRCGGSGSVSAGAGDPDRRAPSRRSRASRTTDRDGADPASRSTPIVTAAEHTRRRRQHEPRRGQAARTADGTRYTLARAGARRDTSAAGRVSTGSSARSIDSGSRRALDEVRNLPAAASTTRTSAKARRPALCASTAASSGSAMRPASPGGMARMIPEERGIERRADGRQRRRAPAALSRRRAARGSPHVASATRLDAQRRAHRFEVVARRRQRRVAVARASARVAGAFEVDPRELGEDRVHAPQIERRVVCHRPRRDRAAVRPAAESACAATTR